MKIDFDFEARELINALKAADGYLECEAVILANMKKHIDKNISTIFIQSYLNRLHKYFEDKAVINKGSDGCINYKYAVGFLKTMIATPYWYSWIKTAD